VPRDEAIHSLKSCHAIGHGAVEIWIIVDMTIDHGVDNALGAEREAA
jgi:hypothetical protein